MNNKKVVGILVSILMIVTSMPMIEATAINENHSNRDTDVSSQLRPCFLAGLMYRDYVDVGWCTHEVWVPICVIRIGQCTPRHQFLGESQPSKVFDLGDYVAVGYIGNFARYANIETRLFFICALMIPKQIPA